MWPAEGPAVPALHPGKVWTFNPSADCPLEQQYEGWKLVAMHRQGVRRGLSEGGMRGEDCKLFACLCALLQTSPGAVILHVGCAGLAVEYYRQTPALLSLTTC